MRDPDKNIIDVEKNFDVPEMITAREIEMPDDEKVIFARYRPWKLTLTIVFWVGVFLVFLHDLQRDKGILNDGGIDSIKWYFGSSVSLLGISCTTYLLWRSLFKSRDAVYIKSGHLLINYTFYDYSIPIRDIRSFRKISYFNMINVERKSKTSGLIVCFCFDIGSKNLMKMVEERIKSINLIDINLMF